MQEHIKRLAVEAGLAYDADGLLYASIKECYDMTPELTAFAQAVARACAGISENERFTYSDDEWRVRCEVAETIRARFGLEG